MQRSPPLVIASSGTPSAQEQRYDLWRGRVRLGMYSRPYGIGARRDVAHLFVLGAGVYLLWGRGSPTGMTSIGYASSSTCAVMSAARF